MELKHLSVGLFIGLLSVLSQANIQLPPNKDVTMPPVIERQPAEEIAYKTGERVELPCQAKGNPKPEYKWTRNGKPLVINGADIKQLPGSGTLVIEQPSSDHEGTYQCNANNAHGTALSIRTMLKLAILHTFPTVPQAKEHSPLVGDKLTLKCAPPTSYPSGLLYWAILRPGEKFTALKTDDRVTVDYDGFLHFANVKVEDSLGNQPYSCVVENVELRSIVSGDDQVIFPQIRSATPQFRAPDIMWSSDTNRVALKGGMLKMKCIFAGYPTPKVKWSRTDNKPLSSMAKEQDFGMELYIPTVDMDDDGKYQCEGSNDINLPSVKKSFRVTVEAAPFWSDRPQDIMASEEENVVFKCGADGRPKPTISWSFNGVPYESMDKTDARLKVERDGLVTFNNLTKDDAQVLQCNASNEHGYIFTNAYLNVLAEPPTIMEKPDASLTIAEGKSVNITCRAFGAPKPVITWKMEGKVVQGDRFKVLPSGDLNIDPVTTEDTGKFYCHAHNKFGDDESAGGLLVREKTQILNGPQSQDVNASDEVVFKCNAKTDTAEKLTITWLKDGKKIDFTKNQQVSLNTDDHSVTIRKSKTSDSGEYTCVADNGLDNDTMTAVLTVKDRPDPPKEIRITRCAATSIRFEWVPGAENYAEITKFHLYWNSSFDEDGKYHFLDKKPKGVQQYTWKNPSPWANYTFHILAENSMGMSDRSVFSAVCKVGPDIPMKHPENVCLDSINANELVITWDPMTKIDHNGLNFHYKVGFQRQDIAHSPQQEIAVDKWDQGRLVITDDIPTFTKYVVYVKAINELGASRATLQKVKGYSGEGAPLETPRGFAVDEDSINDTSALFTWEPVDESPEKVQGYFRGYRIQFWKEGNMDEKRVVDVILKEYDRCKKAGTVARGRRQANDMVQGHVNKLWPYSKISAGVMVLNGRHTGDLSDVISFTTLEGKPGKVAGFGVKEAGSHHLKLWWTPPIAANGILIGYEITYYEVYRPSTLKTEKVMNPLQTSYNLKGLTAKTKYQITIAAMTAPGLGLPMMDEGETLENSDPDVPGFGKVSVGDNSFNVSWVPSAEEKKNPGSEFYVRYKKQGEDEWTNEYPEDNEAWVNVTSLEPGETYEVQIVAVNGAGKESRSKIRTVKVGPQKEAVVGPKFASMAWFVALICIIIFLLLILLIICLIKRNRGGKYPVHEKEKLRGRDPDKDDEEGGFGEYTRADEPDLKKSNRSLNSEEKPLESETDSMYDDYGDAGKFNEDGSFIGQYGGRKSDQKPAEPDTTSPSALSTFV